MRKQSEQTNDQPLRPRRCRTDHRYSRTWDTVQVHHQTNTQQGRRKLHWFSWSSLGENRWTVISPKVRNSGPFLTKCIHCVIVSRNGHLAVCVTSRSAPSAFWTALWFLLEINCIKLFDCIGQQIIKLDRISWIIKMEFRLCVQNASIQRLSTETSLKNLQILSLRKKFAKNQINVTVKFLLKSGLRETSALYKHSCNRRPLPRWQS